LDVFSFINKGIGAEPLETDLLTWGQLQRDGQRELQFSDLLFDLFWVKD
jgi:hypothetical protein